LLMDVSGHPVIEAARTGFFTTLASAGVMRGVLIHDILPVRMPDVFPPGAEEDFRRWLHVVMTFEFAIATTESGAHDLMSWRTQQSLPAMPVTWSHLGADFTTIQPDDISHHARELPETLKGRTYFLAVGTLEPRKGHGDIIDAFETLWREGSDACLVIVGKEGWTALPDTLRRTIPDLVRRLDSHPERGQRLLWLSQVDDQMLKTLYHHCAGLIGASLGEGFGLPIIEAAAAGAPLILRDIAVFREVTNQSAVFFNSYDGTSLTEVIRDMMTYGKPSLACNMQTSTWKQCAERLAAQIVAVSHTS
jgi:glycosyltransferase involved in cell wall biosynthesis